MTFFDKPTVLVQGITGRHGAFHTKTMLEAGTNIVAGVTPDKGGQSVHGIPVYDNIREAKSAHISLDTSIVFVPAPFAKKAVFEAIDCGIKQIVVITEGIPVQDALLMHAHASIHGAKIIGPNCPGLIVPGSHKLGIIASHITSPGHTAIISRSGTLTYELADALTKKGIGQSIILGIGGDPIPGTSFIDALMVVNEHEETKQIILVGEIGGTSEQLAADYIAEHITKPVYGLVVGHSAPAGQTFGHAGAIVGSDSESAEAKTNYMQQKGLTMSETLNDLTASISAF